MQSITQEYTVIINLEKSTCWICPYCDMKIYKCCPNLWLKYEICKGCQVSWRLNLFLLRVRFHYYLCSRVNEKRIEMTPFFPSVCTDITGVLGGTCFQVTGLMSAASEQRKTRNYQIHSAWNCNRSNHSEGAHELRILDFMQEAREARLSNKANTEVCLND